MATIPVPRSYSQILGSQLSAFFGRSGLTRLAIGDPVLSWFEATAQSDFRTIQDIFQLLTAISLDTARGVALERIGLSEGVPKIGESFAFGTVTISDSSFSKISSKVYQGAAAPLVGTTNLKVTDASSFGSSGWLYIGRGTQNYEGPIEYGLPVDSGTFWTVPLVTTTQRFHNVGETVIMAQGGDRLIGAGTIVQTGQSNLSLSSQYSLLYETVIPDGETTVNSVQVVANKAGKSSNCIAGAIKEFQTSPFAGATVTNPLPISNGQATELDDEYRERIRERRQSRSRGTVLAIETNLVGSVSQDENRRITSASVVEHEDEPVVVYIDDGTGYEETSQGVAIEVLTDEALNNQQYFQVSSTPPIAKAFVETVNVQPFNLTSGSILGVKVGGVEYEHTFDSSEFRSISNASAYEVVASINADPDIEFHARTSSSGQRVVVFAKTDTSEDVEVTEVISGTDANLALLFPLGRHDTMRLYLNDRLLTKDGETAAVTSNNPNLWAAISGSPTIIMEVDGTPSATYTFTDQDFIDADTGYSVVGNNDVDAWVAVFNAKIPGITASNDSGFLGLVSNLDRQARSQIVITGGDLVTAGMFDAEDSQGANKDYTLDRNHGQIKLTTPLSEGDKLTIGSESTRAFLESAEFTTITLASDVTTWFGIDADAQLVQVGANSTTPLEVSVSGIQTWGYRMRLTSVDPVFTNAEVGQWLVISDTSFDSSLLGAWRISDKANEWLEFERVNMDFARSRAAFAVLSATELFVCGGYCGTGPTMPSNTAAIFDSATGLWTPVASMVNARAEHTASLLPNGTVLAVGGIDGDGDALVSCEIYDPVGNTWTTADDLPMPTYQHAAVLYGTDVLVAGGRDETNAERLDAHLYDTVGQTWSTTGSLNDKRTNAPMVVMTNTNQVLIAGGEEAGAALTSCELFSAGAWAAAASLAEARSCHGLVYLDATNEVLAFGGHDYSPGIVPTDTTEIYDEGLDSWAAEGALNNARTQFAYGVFDVGPPAKVIAAFGALDGAAPYAEVWTAGAPGSWVATTDEPISALTDIIRAYPVYGLLGTDFVIAGGEQSDVSPVTCSASGEVLATGAGTWSTPDPAIDPAVTLADAGIAVVDSGKRLLEVTIPSGADYTAPTLSDAFNDELDGATSNVYRTNQVRINTNTFDITGDIAYLASTDDTVPLDITTDAIDSTTGHMASVESGNPETGTPYFRDWTTGGATADTVPYVYGTTAVAPDWTNPKPDYLLVALRNYEDSGPVVRWGTNAGFYSTISAVEAFGSLSKATLNTALPNPWDSSSRLYLAAPYATGWDSDLTVVIDQDVESKRFPINMYRNLESPNNTYGSQVTLADADASSTLSLSFGLDYDFTDHAVFMHSRIKTHDATASKRILWRYYRMGAEGNYARVRYRLPDAPDAAVDVDVDTTTGRYTDIDVKLAGGAEKTGISVRSSSKVGYGIATSGDLKIVTYVFAIAINQVERDGADKTIFTLDMPTNITDHGYQVNDVLYLESNNPNWLSGTFVVSGRTATTIEFTNTALGVGVVVPTVTNGGTISFDTTEVSLSGAALAANDFFRIETTSGLSSTVEGETVRLTEAKADVIDGHYVVGVLEGYTAGNFATVQWATLADADAVVAFANPGQTATVIAAAVNGLGDACPITATVTGTGLGTITQSSAEEDALDPSWYYLTDGVNWIKSQVTPGDTLTDYEFVFKDAVSADLISNSDWQNEEIRLVPITTDRIVDWLNNPAISGLYANATIEASSQSTKVQIYSETAGSTGAVQVQGGTGNAAAATVYGSGSLITGGGETYALATFPAANLEGFAGGMWTSIDSSVSLPKNIIDSNTFVNAISTAGFFETDPGSTPLFTVHATSSGVRVSVEKQGDFVAISDNGLATALTIGATVEGDWVRFDAGTMSANNRGIFRIVRIVSPGIYGGGTIWVENPLAVEESNVTTNIQLIDHESIMPGDTLSISTDLWGVENKGLWTIKYVGSETASTFVDQVFTVDLSERTPVTASPATDLGTEYYLVQVLEGEPTRLIKRIHSISPNQDNPDYADVKFSTSAQYQYISNGGGSIMTALDKLAFGTGIIVGNDGYRYNTGLIGEAGKILYGLESDKTTYPGVVAAGAKVNSAAAIVRRITISLLIRAKSGVAKNYIANSVRSTVAALINETGVGESISLSDVVSAAGRAAGVVSVTLISPAYGVGNDLIDIQPFEKPRILDIDQDITVSFVGD